LGTFCLPTFLFSGYLSRFFFPFRPLKLRDDTDGPFSLFGCWPHRVFLFSLSQVFFLKPSISPRAYSFPFSRPAYPQEDLLTFVRTVIPSFSRLRRPKPPLAWGKGVVLHQPIGTFFFSVNDDVPRISFTKVLFFPFGRVFFFRPMSPPFFHNGFIMARSFSDPFCSSPSVSYHFLPTSISKGGRSLYRSLFFFFPPCK